MEAYGSVMEGSRGALKHLVGVLEASGDVLEASGIVFETTWRRLGSVWRRLGRKLGKLFSVLVAVSHPLLKFGQVWTVWGPVFK